jgi:hypothetical protein
MAARQPRALTHRIRLDIPAVVDQISLFLELAPTLIEKPQWWNTEGRQDKRGRLANWKKNVLRESRSESAA